MTTVVTITESDGNVFLEVDGDHDRSIVQVLGILEVAKALALEQAS